MKRISESYLRGAEDFQFKEATRKFVDEVRSFVQRSILIDKSTSKEEQQDAIAAANEAMKELEDETNALLEEKLWRYTEHV